MPGPLVTIGSPRPVRAVSRRRAEVPSSPRCSTGRRPTPGSIRVSPNERIDAEPDDLCGPGRELGEALEQVARAGVGLLMQSATQAAVTELRGRERCSPAPARGTRRLEARLPAPQGARTALQQSGGTTATASNR